MGKPSTWIGIDLGVTGAVAVLDRDDMVQIHDFDYHELWGRKFLDAYLTLRLMDELPRPREVGKVCIEQPGAFTPNANVVLQLGHAWGVVEACFARYDYRVVKPRDWQRHYLNGTGEPSWSKGLSLRLARELFPDAEGYLGRKKDDGRADALLLAGYARER